MSLSPAHVALAWGPGWMSASHTRGPGACRPRHCPGTRRPDSAGGRPGAETHSGLCPPLGLTAEDGRGPGPAEAGEGTPSVGVC